MQSNHEAFNVRATASTMIKVPLDGLKSQHCQAFISKNLKLLFKRVGFDHAKGLVRWL
jgi:hypothetical protein